MLFAIQQNVLGFWGFWSGLFQPLPYGDPYLAVAALFVIVVVAAKLAFGRETT